MTTQDEAMRLADALETRNGNASGFGLGPVCDLAALMLRQQAAEIEALTLALEGDIAKRTVYQAPPGMVFMPEGTAAEIERLRAALAKIADWDSNWGPFPENNDAWRAMVVVTAREAVPELKPNAAIDAARTK